MNDEDKLNAIRLISTPQIGPITYSLLIARFGSPTQAVLRAPELAKRRGRTLRLLSKQEALSLQKRAADAGITLLIKGAEDYPQRLLTFDDAPVLLYAKGHLSLLQKNMLAIVGARNASLNAMTLTSQWAKDIGKEGIVVVSGLARGIDRAAHIGSLTTGTIGISGCGIDVVYPQENQDLYDELSLSGLILCEAPLGTKPSPRQFPARNRIIASLAQAVLVIEAAKGSGSLITAREVAERGGEVLVIPGHPADQRSLGGNQLIKDGAHLVNNVEDVLTILEKPLGEPITLRPSLSDEKMNDIDDEVIKNLADEILNFMTFEAVHIDELTQQCHVSAKVIQIALLELELAGHIERLSGNKVCKLLNS